MYGFMRLIKGADEVGHLCLIENEGLRTWFDCFLIGGLTGTNRHIGWEGRGRWVQDYARNTILVYESTPPVSGNLIEQSREYPVLTLFDFRSGLTGLISPPTYVYGRGFVYRSPELDFQGDIEWDIGSENIYPGAYSGPRP